MAKRFVLVHYDFGIYLGSCMGLGFWTMLDCAGQYAAVTFPSIFSIKEHVGTWEPPFDQTKIWFVEVETDAENYATIEILRRAGLSHMFGDLETEALKYMAVQGTA